MDLQKYNYLIHESFDIYLVNFLNNLKIFFSSKVPNEKSKFFKNFSIESIFKTLSLIILISFIAVFFRGLLLNFSFSFYKKHIELFLTDLALFKSIAPRTVLLIVFE